MKPVFFLKILLIISIVMYGIIFIRIYVFDPKRNHGIVFTQVIVANMKHTGRDKHCPLKVDNMSSGS